MINNKTVAVVIPAYNEEKQIQYVLGQIPGFVDRIVIVNDGSSDGTSKIVEENFEKAGTCKIIPVTKNKENNPYYEVENMIGKIKIEEIKFFPSSEVVHKQEDNRLVLINVHKNSGVGWAISRGYKWARDNNIDCTAVMAGDGQMDPDELLSICEPIIFEKIDYVKGDRLSHPGASAFIPRTRFIGNSILTILTKVASGYWHVTDTQTGYTAISLNALNRIKLHKIYPKYGMPNDMLVKLNIAGCTLKEVDIKPVYNIGEISKMKVFNVIPRISWLLFRSFFKRIGVRYFIKSFHPLFILYNLALLLILISVPYGIKIIIHSLKGIAVNPLTALAFIFTFISGFQSLLFAMWMDIQDNERLYKN
jgi:glycosyltransferase involved in cell wall biosynthesis